MQIRWTSSWPALFNNRRLLVYPLLSGGALAFGALREVLVAHQFGAGGELDAFAAALCIYLFFGTQIGNGLETTFIARYAHCNQAQLSERLFSSQLGVLTVLLIACAIFLPLCPLLFHHGFGFDDSQTQLAQKVVYVFIPAIIAATAISLGRATLYIVGDYVPGFSYGVTVSLSVIASLLLFQPWLGIYSLPLGYGIGNVIMLVTISTKLLSKLRLDIPRNLSGFRAAISEPFKIWWLAALVLVVEFLYQGSYITERALAARCGEGTLSAYFYATSLVLVFTALIIQPTSTILFPKIARAYKNDRDHARRYVLRICLIMLAIGVAAALVMNALSGFVVENLLVRGKFTAEDGQKTIAIFQVLVFVIPFIAISRILKNSLYSSGNYRLPVISNALRWLMLGGLGSLLTVQYGIKGVALASVASTAADCVIMFFVLLKKK